METMVSTSANYLRIKLAFKPTRRSGKKRRRRSMVLVVMVHTLEINMRGQGLVARRMIASNLEIVPPKHISPFGVKEEVLLKLPKQGLDEICIGMDVL
jgi:hypothetical protein